MIVIYFLLLIILFLYSFALVDPNLTLINHPLWVWFREKEIFLGYYQRDLSSIIYLVIVISLFLVHFYLVKKYKQYNPIKIALITGLLLLLSYPFLSHDFFNYIFDAKILTFYHQNPYLHKALDFPKDQWLRFMHWTDRSYPYGPTFLLITIIPSFLSFGKFFLNFLLFKITFFLFYLAAVYCLQKLNKKWALLFATHPLVIVEGLVSSHNDLVAVSLAVIGIYYLFKKREILARLLLLFSFGIKYITIPLLFLRQSSKKYNYIVISGLGLIMLYLSLNAEIQPWYFLSIFAVIPFFENIIAFLNIFFAGLLFSYYPYIRFGGWDLIWKVNLKHQIILVFFIVNLIYLFFKIKKNNSLKDES